MQDKEQIRRNVDWIKSRIMRVGGLIISGRQTGKSTALLELLRENEDFILIVTTEGIRKTFIQKLREMDADAGLGGSMVPIGGKRIMTMTYYNESSTFYGKQKDVLLIDEYFNQPIFFKEFRGAVSSMIFPISLSQYIPPPEEYQKLARIMDPMTFALNISQDFEALDIQR